MIISEYDPGTVDQESLLQLQESIYPGQSSLRRRWEWEFVKYPRGPVKIFIAEDHDRPVGMTVRTPFSFRVDGVEISACFATNSMVHKDYRGQGIIQDLYDAASGSAVLQFSKGTAPAMYHRLLKMGYYEIKPNNYMTCVLSPGKWLRWKLNGRVPQPSPEEHLRRKFQGFEKVADSGACADALSSGCRAAIPQDAAYIRWRYFDNPVRKYSVYLRQLDGRCVSRSVLRTQGATAYLVDVRWDSDCPDEPTKTVRFLKAAAKQQGSVKLVAWATLDRLRSALQKEQFFHRKETPHFSFWSKDRQWIDFPWESAHFVHGDGDIDYL